MEELDPILCPFCGFKAEGDYQIMLHMETLHSENGESPFVAKDDASIAALISLQDEQDVQYVNCPVDGCGEALLLTDIDNHLEMHEEEQDHSPEESDDSSRSAKRLKLEPQVKTSFDTKLAYALRNLDDDDGQVVHEKPSHDTQTAAKNTWKTILKMPDSSPKAEPTAKPTANSSKKRLGKAELGPHAHEKQMPAWLVKLLKEEDGAIKFGNKLDRDGKLRRVRYCPNQTEGIIPVLAQCLEQDESTSYAYICDEVVRHVSKLKKEGGFCGYRNIQVMCSYIIGAESQGYEIFNGKIPTIFDIQEFIESAWDLGINAQGRIETGGIRGTRKYIGTPDAQAMFCSLGIACEAQGLRPKGNSSRPAYELLFTAVENYFINGCTDYDPKVRRTGIPPIYFQHPGHSMTIVGFEKQKDGSRNLIVFDPMFHDAMNVTKLVGIDFVHKHPDHLLKAYRRGVKYLRKHHEFEILKLTPPKVVPVGTSGLS